VRQEAAHHGRMPGLRGQQQRRGRSGPGGAARLVRAQALAAVLAVPIPLEERLHARQPPRPRGEGQERGTRVAPSDPGRERLVMRLPCRHEAPLRLWDGPRGLGQDNLRVWLECCGVAPQQRADGPEVRAQSLQVLLQQVAGEELSSIVGVELHGIRRMRSGAGDSLGLALPLLRALPGSAKDLHARQVAALSPICPGGR